MLLLLVPPISAASSHAAGTNTEGIPILAYHRFDPSKPGSTTIRTSVFKAQLEWLDSHHVRIVKPSAVVDALRGVGPEVKTPTVAALAYAGGASHPGVDMFAIPRIPVSDQDSGGRFGTLLGKQNVANKEVP